MPPKGKAKGAKAAKGLTKAQLTAEVAGLAKLSKAQVGEVFSALFEVVAAELKAGRPATIPNLAKLVLKRKDATKAREGINPFTKERMLFKAKPAHNVVRARVPKALKDKV
jgi:DNA-binding protein HU-beta